MLQRKKDSLYTRTPVFEHRRLSPWQRADRRAAVVYRWILCVLARVWPGLALSMKAVTAISEIMKLNTCCKTNHLAEHV